MQKADITYESLRAFVDNYNTVNILDIRYGSYVI